MKGWSEQIGGRECTVYAPEQGTVHPQFLLLQAVDDNDLAVMNGEVAALQKSCPGAQAALASRKNGAGTEGGMAAGFVLAAFKISDWNSELTPWEAPPVWGRQGYGAGAPQTLDYVLHTLLPFLRQRYDPHCETKVILGGYSLAGLFALWAGYQKDEAPADQKKSTPPSGKDDRLSDITPEQSSNRPASVFSGIAAASPSVWYPGWIDYAKANTPKTPVIYLSLGDREEKARNPVMSTVGSCIRQQYALLQQQRIRSALEWNPGNHFKDSDLRTARAFLWVMENI